MNGENIECAGCQNTDCDSYTLFKGTLLCGYCFEDFITAKISYDSIEEFLIKQRVIMRKDRENNKSSEVPK